MDHHCKALDELLKLRGVVLLAHLAGRGVECFDILDRYVEEHRNEMIRLAHEMTRS